jgi:hypothetical protein
MNFAKYLKSLLLVTIIGCMVSGCDVQKRVYKEGYYITHHQKTESSNKNKVIEHEAVYASAKALPLSVIDHQQLIPFEKTSGRTMPSDTCGDVMLLSSYMELKGRIKSITDSIVEYNICYENRGIVDTMHIRNIKMIKFNNGSVRYFDPEFEAIMKNPICNDSLKLKNNNWLVVKILNVNEIDFKYIDCKEVGVIKKIDNNELKEVISSNKSLNMITKAPPGIRINRSTFWNFIFIDFLMSIIEGLTHL